HDRRPSGGSVLQPWTATLPMSSETNTAVPRAQADQSAHATARDAASTARDARAERLLITHFSARYADPAPLVAEARAVFPNTDAAEELRRYCAARDT